MAPLKRLLPFLLLLAALLGAFFAYSPGLHGPFLFDDGPNIVENQHLKIGDLSLERLKDAAFSVPSGLFYRPLSSLSFALNYYFDADRVSPFPVAYPFKLTNVLLHTLNCALLFMLIRLLAGANRKLFRPDLPDAYPDWLALFVAAAWLLHPLNLTSVLYVVQRMTELSALFVMLGLIAFTAGRKRMLEGKRGGLILVPASAAFIPLAILCKENGALLPFYMLAIEALIFRLETATVLQRRMLAGFYAAFALLPALAATAYLVIHPGLILAGFDKRAFTLAERLMTEARVIWFYLRLIILPDNALMGMYHDDFTISRALLEPATTLLSILGILALLSGAWLLRRREPLIALGVLIFFIGQSMESTFIPLELVFEHRNYFPMIGILLAFFHLLLEPFHAVDTRHFRRGLAVLLIAIFTFDTFMRAEVWADSFSLWQREAENHPQSARANTELADLYALDENLKPDPLMQEINHQSAREYYEKAAPLDTNGVAALFGLVKLEATHGKPVEKRWLDELGQRLALRAIPSNTNALLTDLTRCRMKENCTLSAADLEQLLNAPLTNPHVSGRDRALAYSALSYYFLSAARNYPAAIDAARQAMALDSQDLAYRIHLITALIYAHRDREAQEEIRALKQLDVNGGLTSEIAPLEEQLMQKH
jgi:hypothetical protein